MGYKSLKSKVIYIKLIVVYMYILVSSDLLFSKNHLSVYNVALHASRLND